jgi:hypothetical protein
MSKIFQELWALIDTDSSSMHTSKSFGGDLVALLKFLPAIDDDGC